VVNVVRLYEILIIKLLYVWPTISSNIVNSVLLLQCNNI